MNDLTRDLRHALRGLLASPGFTLVALVTLALGIGVNSSIFSLVNAVLFKPLPVEQPERLVDVYGHTATSDTHDSSSWPNYVDYREGTETLSGLIAYTNFFANFSLEGSSELVVGEIVSENYFDVLGVQPALGRSFTPDDFGGAGESPVAILSHPFWTSRFGADPGVLDRTFRMNGIVYTVIGVAPEGFGGMMPAATAQMWIPVTMVEEVEPLGNNRGSGSFVGPTRLERRAQHWLWMRGRMRPDVEIEQVRTELQGIAARLAAEYPASNEFERVAIVETAEVAINPDLDDAFLPAGLVLLGAVGLVLLVACANLANMTLARASSRRHEYAVRLALGAGRKRLMKQSLTESMVLALAGGIVALGIARWLSAALARYQPPVPIDISLDVSPDVRVLAFTFGVAVLTGIVFGLVPAWRASRPDLVASLKQTGEGDRPGRGFELRDGLVVAQVAVSLVLLVSASLMIRSVGAASRVDFGYDLDRVAFLALAMEMNGYDEEAAGVFYQEGLARLEARPDVEAVALASRVPLSVNNNGFALYIEGHQSARTDEPYRLDGARVDEGYFSTLDLRLVEGRPIEAGDRDGPAQVAVVTEEMVERYWPGQRGVGQQFRTSWGGTPYRIVGVVEDYKVDTPGEDPKPYIHLPLQRETVFANFVVRTAAGTAAGGGAAGSSDGAAALVPELEAELRALDADLVFLDTGTARDLAAVRLFPIQAGAALLAAFGVLAVLLAAVGLYGVIGYSVTRRLREIGIRKALGARDDEVVGRLFRRGLVLVGVGALLGLAGAVAGASVLSSVLFVGVFDLPSFGLALGVLVTVAALANYIPARRATRVDPVSLLRSE